MLEVAAFESCPAVMKPEDVTIDELVEKANRPRRSRPSKGEGLEPGDHRHGTVNGYNNCGCRCERCTEAWRLYVKGYRSRTPEPQRQANRKSYHRRKQKEQAETYEAAVENQVKLEAIPVEEDDDELDLLY